MKTSHSARQRHRSRSTTETVKPVEIIYDPRAKTLEIRINTQPILVITDFRIEDHMQLDGGQAYIGIVSSTGAPDGPGPNYLYNWSASFPQSCEEVTWVEPLTNSLFTGYSGDTFDHKITGDFLQEGDRIREELMWLWDDVGLTETDKLVLRNNAKGTWGVGSRQGMSGLWRVPDPLKPPPVVDEDKFDSHAIETQESIRPTFRNFLNAGGTAGTAIFAQTMRLIDADSDADNDLVITRHRIIYKFVKIAPEFTGQPPGPPACTFEELYLFHQVVQKQNAHNTQGVWDSANTAPPWTPCP